MCVVNVVYVDLWEVLVVELFEVLKVDNSMSKKEKLII